MKLTWMRTFDPSRDGILVRQRDTDGRKARAAISELRFERTIECDCFQAIAVLYDHDGRESCDWLVGADRFRIR